jgi:hypothetical protein
MPNEGKASRPMHSRRRFIFDCSAALAALGLVPAASAGWLGRPSGTVQSLDQLSYAALAAQVNTPFRVQASPGQVVELTLLKAPLAPPLSPAPGRRPSVIDGHERFSLIFAGPKEGLLEPGIHRFEHRQLGRFEMYVGQIGSQDPARVRYEAVFNRPAPENPVRIKSV